MRLHYDDDFMEAAVFLCASGRRSGVPPLQIARFHRAREKLYGILDPDDRNRAFFGLHVEWFREWGMERPITGVLREFPLLAEQLALLAIRKSQGKTDEGAELYVNEAGQRSGILALRPERVLEAGALAAFLRHELTHLNDMVDAAFGYAPALDLPGLNAAQQRLARERYRLLWDITIDGRLEAGGHPPMAGRGQHVEAFQRAYAFWPVGKQVAVFDALWRTATPRHRDLLALISDPRGLQNAQGPTSGAACPLCDFPTFAWALAESLSSAAAARVGAEFPSWRPEQGLCGRCLEAYEVAVDVRLHGGE